MKLFYDEATDTLDIRFREAEVSESQELAPGIILDLDPAGEPISLEILRASKRVDLDEKVLFSRSIPTGMAKTG